MKRHRILNDYLYISTLIFLALFINGYLKLEKVIFYVIKRTVAAGLMVILLIGVIDFTYRRFIVRK